MGDTTLREQSKKTWTDHSNTIAAINAGSLQRIADATEKMAQRHTDLIRERDKYERLYMAAVAREQRLGRRLSASKGQITKLRNAAKKDHQ